jgi:hypothetical protein
MSKLQDDHRNVQEQPLEGVGQNNSGSLDDAIILCEYSPLRRAKPVDDERCYS